MSRAAAGTVAALSDRRPGERDSVVAEARKCEALFGARNEPRSGSLGVSPGCKPRDNGPHKTKGAA